MASPSSYFVYLWEVAQTGLVSAEQMESGHAPKRPSPRDSWLFLPYLLCAGPNCLTSSCPFHFMKQATNSNATLKIPGWPALRSFYYPLRNVSVIEIESNRVLWSCHLAFYLCLPYLSCAFKPQSGRSLPEGPAGLKPRMSSLIPRPKVKQRSPCPRLFGSQEEEKEKEGKNAGTL